MVEFQEDHPDEALSIEIAKLPALARTLFQGLLKQGVPREDALRQTIEVYASHRQNVPTERPGQEKPHSEAPGK